MPNLKKQASAEFPIYWIYNGGSPSISSKWRKSINGEQLDFDCAFDSGECSRNISSYGWSNIKPGYKVRKCSPWYGDADGQCTYGADTYALALERDWTQENVWDPIKYKYNNTTGSAKKQAFDAALKCCNGNGLLSLTEKRECGSLWDGLSDGSGTCSSMLADHCDSSPTNLLNMQQCRDYYHEGKLQTDLQKVCNNKITKDSSGKWIPDPKWADLCACHYPSDFYTDLNKMIGAEWGVDYNYMDNNPECMYPLCKNNNFKDDNVTCDPVSFVKCVQNAHFDLGSGTVDGDINFEQDSQCENKWTKNRDYGTTNSDNTDSGSTASDNTGSDNTGSDNTGADGGNSDLENPDTIFGFDKKLVLIFMLLVIAVVGYFFMAKPVPLPAYPEYSEYSGYQQDSGYSEYQQDSGYPEYQQDSGYPEYQQDSGYQQNGPVMYAQL
jgi:hypothetical protein